MLGVMAVASTAYAQQRAGDKELGIGGNFDFRSSNGTQLTSGSVQVSLGVFASRHVKVSLGSTLDVTAASDGGTSSSGAALYGASYYFGGEGATTYPYIGVGGQTFFSRGQDVSSTSTSYTGIAGLQHYVNRNSSFFAETSYSPTQDGGFHIPITFGFRVVF